MAVVGPIFFDTSVLLAGTIVLRESSDPEEEPERTETRRSASDARTREIDERAA